MSENNLNISKLWKENADFVLKVCKSYVKDAEIAEDIRQDVFLKIIYSKKSFNKASTIRTWLYSIAYRCCMDYFRNQKKQKEITKECFSAGAFYTSDSDFPVWEVNEPADMPCPISQLIVELYFGEGWSKQEISGVFGFNMAQVNIRIQMGVNNLQNFLN